MPRFTRFLLPFAVLGICFASLFLFLPDAPGGRDFASRLDVFLARPGQPWVVALVVILMMVGADFLWRGLRIAKARLRTRGRHWSELRNRHGFYFCASCHSVYLSIPEDLDERKYVHCGDCGYKIAHYGEMREALNGHPEVEFYTIRLD
ncbi:MAG: hypothetical protein AAGE37_03605 [Pseudomonadota bacterium]